MATDKDIFDDIKSPRGRRGRQGRILDGNDSGREPYISNTGNIGAPSTSHFHLSISVLSRAKGHSATAAAAYRSGGLIVDERTGDKHDYRRKTRVELSEVVAPPGSPSWVYDRNRLWNEVEKAEKRGNSCIAREWQISIPKGFNELQAIELTRALSEEITDRHSIVVEFSIHKDNPKNWDGTEKGADSFHAHILGSTRRITSSGFGEKSRELDDRKPLADYENKSRGQLEVTWWRERFAAIANRHLEQLGRIERIDHRSYKTRGITQLAQPKLGSALTRLTREDPAKSEVLARWAAAKDVHALQGELASIENALHTVTVEVSRVGLQVDLLRKEKQEVVMPVRAVNQASRTPIEDDARRKFPGQDGKQRLYVKAVLEAQHRFAGQYEKQAEFLRHVAERLEKVAISQKQDKEPAPENTNLNKQRGPNEPKR